nr:MAG TPA: hypothetical protein [Caudoviricetes sp.]
MSVLASAMITLTYVTSVESETRYYKTQVSTLSPPSKPTSVPPGNGWIETEPTYSDSSVTSVLYTCVLTQFTDGTFAYSEVSVSSSYEASKSAYNQAHEANQKLASWCSKTDTTLFDGAKIATGSVITEALDAGCVTTDKLATGAVKAKNIDTENLFAQDITASGSITGVTLKGAEITGENIKIHATNDATSFSILTTEVLGTKFLLLTTSVGTTKSLIGLAGGSLTLEGQAGIDLNTQELTIKADTITDANYSADTYTSFSGNVVSNGAVTVTKKLGVCFLNGGITLTAAASGWVTLLDSSAVPAPQNGEAIIMTLPSWKAPTTNPARLRIPADGGLQITRGSANAFWINLAYPIE